MNRSTQHPKFAVFVTEKDEQVSPWSHSHLRAAEWTELHTDLGMPGQPAGYMVVSIDGHRYREILETKEPT